MSFHIVGVDRRRLSSFLAAGVRADFLTQVAAEEPPTLSGTDLGWGQVSALDVPVGQASASVQNSGLSVSGASSARLSSDSTRLRQSSSTIDVGPILPSASNVVTPNAIAPDSSAIAPAVSADSTRVQLARD